MKGVKICTAVEQEFNMIFGNREYAFLILMEDIVLEVTV